MTQASFSPLDRLDGRVAVIAGGTGAIGLASARRLAALGARCVLLYLHDEPAEAEAKADALPGEGHAALRASITDSASLREAAAEVRQRYGQVHILVNSAG